MIVRVKTVKRYFIDNTRMKTFSETFTALILWKRYNDELIRDWTELKPVTQVEMDEFIFM